MERRASVTLAATLLAALIIYPGTVSLAGPSSTTVGEFIARVSALTGQPQRSFLPSSATEAKAAGRSELLEPLTFGVVLEVAAGLGISLKTPSNPLAPVSAEQAGVMATQIAMNYSARGSGVTVDEPPTQCLSSDNRGTCVDCCKQAIGASGQYCGRFCHANVPPPPSPGEPAP